MLRADEHLDERGRDTMLAGLRFGDPHDEVLGAWLAKEAVRSVTLSDDVDEAAVLLDNAIEACSSDAVPEIRTMAHTLSRWRTEILNHHRTGASNGPTEGLNFCQTGQACRSGFTNFENYKLRVLLHAGGVTWPRPIQPPRITSTRPH